MTGIGAYESRVSTYSRRLPIVPVQARGVRLRGNDGRWYLDCLAGAGAVSLGWNHPVVTEAVRRTLDSGEPLLSLDFHTPTRDAFVEALTETLPPGLAKDCVVHLCAPSGANAIEAALTAAEIATGGREHVAVQGGFHGCSRAARSVSSGGALRTPRVALGPHVRFLPFPQSYRCPFGVGGEAGVDLAVRAVADAFTDPHSGLVDPASIVSEFVLGEGGVVPAPPRWARALRRAADASAIPLIADEIQAGVYRTGRAWAFEHCGIEPDMIAISKGLGSGIPIAVLVIRREFDVWEPGVFTGTFRGNALAFAAATAVLRYAAENRLGEHVTAMGALLGEGLRAIAAETDLIGEVRTAGLMAGVEIIDPALSADARGTGAPAPALAAELQRECLNSGLIVETGGRYGSVIRFLPPLTIEAAEIAAVVDIFADAVARVCHAPGAVEVA
ncbi:diaminobutyrate--2-oxoglutarate transaminase family protein [Nocardia pseudobrasiliensis]|uniref:Diaminobutyrate--2-oxoglutarate transaminase n=1 Tax=Nocardia pseudobrasiliensis TaxID=45979 RepID=A0A370HRZ7_9NOCA|nr:diaminobutyrate--2-oxoglutarate transaminase family protein [Nocardia pseudobrasiliensis]RDI61313.1 diaminobutyrate aminotransferase [Nocardia pseudobrasiliensis]